MNRVASAGTAAALVAVIVIIAAVPGRDRVRDRRQR